MKTEQEIRERINEFERRYGMVPDDRYAMGVLLTLYWYLGEKP